MKENKKNVKPVEQEKSLLEKLVDMTSPGERGSDKRDSKDKFTESWRPRMEIDENGGYVVANNKPAGNLPGAEDILKEFNLDPAEWRVTSVRKGQWQTFNGDQLESARINIVPIGTPEEAEQQASIEELISYARKYKFSVKTKKTSGDLAYIFAPSDQQLGKRANGEGTEHTLQRLMDATDMGVERLKELQKIGRPIGTVVIALLGDHVEGTTSQNGRLQSSYASDLGLTEQIRLGREILFKQIVAFAPLVERVVVAVVNGNHDEVTRFVAVDPAEGWNTDIASAVRMVCDQRPDLSHVEFRFPSKDHQTLAININGVMLGLFHGHQAKDAENYIKGQAAGMTPLGDCTVLLSGHFHHFKAKDIGPRFWAQCPTVDPGSAWFRDRTGMESRPGLLTMVIGENHDPRKDLSILSLDRLN